MEYARLYGSESWELDALEPQYLEALATRNIRGYIDDVRWEESEALVQEQKEKIKRAAKAVDNDSEAE